QTRRLLIHGPELTCDRGPCPTAFADERVGEDFGRQGLSTRPPRIRGTCARSRLSGRRDSPKAPGRLPLGVAFRPLVGLRPAPACPGAPSKQGRLPGRGTRPRPWRRAAAPPHRGPEGAAAPDLPLATLRPDTKPRPPQRDEGRAYLEARVASPDRGCLCGEPLPSERYRFPRRRNRP